MDSAALDADAEGEEEDMDGDNIPPDAQPYTRSIHVQPPKQNELQTNQPTQAHSQPLHPPSMVDPRTTSITPQPQAHIDHNYKWPQARVTDSTPMSYTTTLPNPGALKRLAPGPESWQAEFQHAVTHSMEGLEGPASASAPTSAG
jgi:hypothetical protein